MERNPRSLCQAGFGLDGKDPLIPYKAPERTLATFRKKQPPTFGKMETACRWKWACSKMRGQLFTPRLKTETAILPFTEFFY